MAGGVAALTELLSQEFLTGAAVNLRTLRLSAAGVIGNLALGAMQVAPEIVQQLKCSIPWLHLVLVRRVQNASVCGIHCSRMR